MDNLAHLTDQVERYRETLSTDGNSLSEILQQITGTLYLLEHERAEYHRRYQAILNEEITKGTSVNKAEVLANNQVPEMYLFRKVLDSAYEVSGAIRTQISWIKSGLNG